MFHDLLTGALFTIILLSWTAKHVLHLNKLPLLLFPSLYSSFTYLVPTLDLSHSVSLSSDGQPISSHFDFASSFDLFFISPTLQGNDSPPPVFPTTHVQRSADVSDMQRQLFTLGRYRPLPAAFQIGWC